MIKNEDIFNCIDSVNHCRNSWIQWLVITNYIFETDLVNTFLHPGPRFAPYIDVTSDQALDLLQYKKNTGINAFSLGFFLGNNGCSNPSWGLVPLDQPKVISKVNEFKNNGGQIIVSSGGQGGTYLDEVCSTAEQLAAAYQKVLNVIGTKHIDLDVEKEIDVDKMNKALVILQKNNPGLTISFTLPADQNGLNDLGKRVLSSAKSKGINVDVVNPMCMEFTPRGTYGEGVIGCAQSTLANVRQYWPNAGYGMIGITPMIGTNGNGVSFSVSDAQKVTQWAKQNGIGRLAFWNYYNDLKNDNNNNAYSKQMVAF